MSKKTTSILFSLLILTGCAPKAYKVIPIPADEKLQEKIVSKDPGVIFNKIAIIDIDGVITNYKRSALKGGENPLATIIEKLEKAQNDPLVKGIVLRLNSPGGTVTASDIIYRKILEIRKGNPKKKIPPKPVVASMQDTCASGAYYIACAANEIITEPTSITGSIGVIILTFNIKTLLNKVGITTKAIKSGDKKDALSPFRPLSPEEQKIFQDIINQLYDRFLQIVSTSRKKTKDQLKPLADGRIFTGQDAVKLGLADKTGSLEDAITRAKQLAGIKSAQVVIYHRPWGYKGSIYSTLEEQIPQPIQNNSIISINFQELPFDTGLFMYLWLPSAR